MGDAGSDPVSDLDGLVDEARRPVAVAGSVAGSEAARTEDSGVHAVQWCVDLVADGEPGVEEQVEVVRVAGEWGDGGHI